MEIIITIVLIIIFLIIWKSKLKKQSNLFEKQLRKENEIKLKQEQLWYENELNALKSKMDKELNDLTNQSKTQLKEIENNIALNKKILKQQEEEKQNYISQGEQLIKNELEIYKEKTLGEINLEIEKQTNSLQNNYEVEKKKISELVFSLEKEYGEKKELAKSEYNSIVEELEDYRSRRAAINELIRKEQELKNEQDYHRILLSDEAKEDIGYLLSIENRINNKALLRKLIWSEYLKKPFDKMINNIFGSTIPKNVIYCIENINTNQKYIGKTSALVSKRWTEHIKTSLGIGVTKKSAIHENLFNHWDDFTFSIIEEVDKDELSSREKYYIGFFETDKYGYNMNSGG